MVKMRTSGSKILQILRTSCMIGPKGAGEGHRGRALISQSCRSIFYYVVRSLLEEAKARTGEARLKIALPAVHFGSFYNLLKGPPINDFRIFIFSILVKLSLVRIWN